MFHQYGGWVDSAKTYSTNSGRCICLPVTISGNYINYRISSLKAAGFDKVRINPGLFVFDKPDPSRTEFSEEELQQLAAEDPSEAVRRAAKTAVEALRRRER